MCMEVIKKIWRNFLFVLMYLPTYTSHKRTVFLGFLHIPQCLNKKLLVTYSLTVCLLAMAMSWFTLQIQWPVFVTCCVPMFFMVMVYVFSKLYHTLVAHVLHGYGASILKALLYTCVPCSSWLWCMYSQSFIVHLCCCRSLRPMVHMIWTRAKHLETWKQS